MSDDDLKHYLPNDETFRRVADRAASDENMRRALERLKASPPLPSVPPLAVSPRTAAATARKPQEWPRWKVTIAAVLTVFGPCTLVYWLFVPRGEAMRTREGAVGAMAKASAPPAALSARGDVATAMEPPDGAAVAGAPTLALSIAPPGASVAPAASASAAAPTLMAPKPSGSRPRTTIASSEVRGHEPVPVVPETASRAPAAVTSAGTVVPPLPVDKSLVGPPKY